MTTATEAGARLSTICEQLAIAVEVPRSEIDAAIEQAIQAGRQLREAVWRAAGALNSERPSWSDPDALQKVVSQLSQQLETLAREGDRERLQLLANELRNGVITNTKPTRRSRLETMRTRAVSEVNDALQGNSPTLPWPPTPVESLVRWFAADDIVQTIQATLPEFGEFLAMLEPDWWDPPTPAEQQSDVAPRSDRELRRDPPDQRARSESSASTGNILTNASAQGTGTGSSAYPGANDRREVARPRFAAPAVLVRRSRANVGGRTDRPTSSSDDSSIPRPPPERTDRQPVEDIGAGNAAALTGAERDHDAPVPGSPAGHFTQEASPFASENAVDASQEASISIRFPDARPLPPTLGSFSEFRAAFWRDERGRVSPAPWRQAGFDQELEGNAQKALAEGRLAHLFIFSQASEVLDLKACPACEDVRDIIGLVSGTLTTPVESDRRHERIQKLVAGDFAEASLALRVSLFLEAVASTPSYSFAPGRVPDLAERAGFSAPMGQVLVGLFTVGSTTENPLGSLRDALQKLPQKSHAELLNAVAQAEAALRSDVKTLWNAAGGKIERTHCRDAWHRFMSFAQPVFSELLSRPDWDDLRRLDGLLAEHAKTADKMQVKFGDRHRMDRAAEGLVSKARAIVTARRAAARRGRALEGHGVPELVEALQKLPRSDASGPDACFVALLDRLIDKRESDNDHPGVFQLVEFHRRPALLETVPVLSIPDAAALDAGIFSDPVSAACHLIFDKPLDADGTVPLSKYLRSIGREDLLAHVQPKSDTDAKFAADAFGKAQANTARVLAHARTVAVAVSGMAHPATLALEAAVGEAEELATAGDAHEAKPEFLLAWLHELAAFGKAAIDESIPALRGTFARRSPTTDENSRFEQALATGHYSDALALAHGEGDAPVVEDRATLWRLAASKEFPNPRRTLHEVQGPHAELCRAWLGAFRDSSGAERVRKLFVSLVFDDVARGKNVREPKARPEVLLSMEPVRTAIARAGLNPSFVPQITAFRDIAIATPPVAPTTSTFVRSTMELLAKGGDDRLTVILAPQVSNTVREQLREEFRRRGRRGVGIVDDLDLVRLLNPGRQEANSILSLLEIVLEQQPKWSQVNPFESHEGQHTKQEMFVGRRDEALALTQRPLYSRLFSGRRLGKSALLKHVYDSQEKANLPSGNRLRVLYVPIVGLDSEDAVVRKIVNAFEALGCPPPRSVDPAERLKELVDSYLRAEPKGSVLVFLDEADMFVEAQIARYDDAREKSLTWKIRSEIEHERDSRDLPRVRFVFAGYRATHRTEGAWANWGDVLRLRPLSRSDAARLISGPLARLGINASSEAASIAYRCGYQPAVLVRFGQQLLEHLDNTVTPARRDSIVLTPELVALIYQSPAVQQEIRTIVWNNFQGNPFGQIVFAALLLEFARIPPGAALDDAPTRVLQRLRGLVPTFMSDESLDGPAVDRIARTLRDFVDRSLLDEAELTTRSYRLRFPHQLSVLLQEDQEAIIRREAAGLGGQRLDAIDEVRSLVPRVALEDVSYALSSDGFAAAVVASHWPEAIDQRAASVAARLDFVGNAVADGCLLQEGNPQLLLDRLVVTNASPESAERVLRSREQLSSAEHPLFLGGLDLLRWSLRRGDGVELANVPRLTPVKLRWWLERVREISWSGASPLRTFFDLTGGIPHLVALLDRELDKVIGFEGASASAEQIERTRAAYENSFERWTRELAAGDPATALDRREQELLVMIALASDEAASSTDDTRAFLLEMLAAPTEYSAFVPGLDAWPGLCADDRVALDVLLRSGLLPTESRATRNDPFERLHPLAPADPARRIASVLRQCLST
ncbi:MAG: hypothetical protein IT375_14645 [Polyangiaceae bacterium]|nr:hypothetical protein [Polyangiaceae bacterium]